MAAEEENDSPKLSLIENLVIGGITMSTVTGVTQTAGAPIERVKLLLQNQGEMLKQGTLSRPYTGVIDCTMQIFRNEFFHSFWRGNLTNCSFQFSNMVLNFALYDKIKAMFEYDPYMGDFTKYVASGGVSGALSLCFVYSLDYARTRLANDVKSIKNGDSGRKYDSLIDVYRKTLATDGIAGLYRGFAMGCVGVIIYRGCYFGLYDTLNPILGPDASLRFSFLLGYGVTLTSNLISYPFDTIQRRMMMTSGEAVKYKDAMDCMTQIIRNESVIAFFKGAGVHIIKSIAGAVLLVGFEKQAQRYASMEFDTSDSA